MWRSELSDKAWLLGEKVLSPVMVLQRELLARLVSKLCDPSFTLRAGAGVFFVCFGFKPFMLTVFAK